MLEHETQSEFALRCGVNKSTVSKWKRAGRLVLTEDGQVDIDATLTRLEATRGVRTDVIDRWRAYRAAQGRPLGPEAPTNPSAPESATSAPDTATSAPHTGHRATDDPSEPSTDPDVLNLDEIGKRTRIAQMHKEEAIARQKQREDEQLAGVLIRRIDVQKDLTDAVAILISAWERLPDRAAPLLLDLSDQAQIRALLRDEVERLAHEIAAQLSHIGDPRDADQTERAA